MTRRDWLGVLSGLGLGSKVAAQPAPAAPGTAKIEPLVLTDAQWQQRLTPAAYNVLRKEGTERAFTSPLNDEKRKGTFLCAGCDLALFTSDMKFDSGTGWPSFFTTLPGVFGTKRDFHLVLPRVEYHCARCGGHHGHVFNDGPKPTGLRYCNNGVALKFAPVMA
jgi:peptide-methionine (R)-S-oxide reductase